MSENDHPRLLLGVTPLAERQIEEQLFAAEQSVAVVGSAADARELLALAERRHADAVLLAAELPALDAGGCARLRSYGLRLVGLALDEQNAHTLEVFGVDQILRPPLSASDIADACAGRENAGISVDEFFALRESPVESEANTFIEVADAVLYNWIGVSGYAQALDELMSDVGIGPARRHASRSGSGA